MTKDELRQVIERANRLVAAQPEWKQNILERSSQPTLNVPRTPVNKFEGGRPVPNPPKPRSCLLWCNKFTYHEKIYYTNFYVQRRAACVAGGMDWVVMRVRVEECDEVPGCYWGWWDNELGFYDLVFHQRHFLESNYYFPGEQAEAQGLGKLTPVRVTELPRSTNS